LDNFHDTGRREREKEKEKDRGRMTCLWYSLDSWRRYTRMGLVRNRLGQECGLASQHLWWAHHERITTLRCTSRGEDSFPWAESGCLSSLSILLCSDCFQI
jgi:hypothetical protein